MDSIQEEHDADEGSAGSEDHDIQELTFLLSGLVTTDGRTVDPINSAMVTVRIKLSVKRTDGIVERVRLGMQFELHDEEI